MLSQWLTLFKWLRRYFRSFGGFAGVAKSPFFGLAIIFVSLNYSLWLSPGWVAKAEALIPSMLGFSLGTYAILFSIMSSRLKGALHTLKNDRGISYIETINATFFHFIFVQVLSIVWAFLYQGTWLVDGFALIDKIHVTPPWILKVMTLAGSFIGCFLLVYSLLLIVAAALAIYRLALIKDPGEGVK